MAILPQGATTPNDLTVKELVSYGRFPYRSLFKALTIKTIKISLKMLWAKTKVDKFASRLVSTLSGGERPTHLDSYGTCSTTTDITFR